MSAAQREAVAADRLAGSATPTTPSALVAAIGSEHASNYAIAPHVIEEVDLELLQEFLGRIGPARIKNDYRARCSKSGVSSLPPLTLWPLTHHLAWGTCPAQSHSSTQVPAGSLDRFGYNDRQAAQRLVQL